MSELRPYQTSAIEQLREAIANKQKVVLSAPTGAGKTRIASEIFSLARAKNKRVCFVVPFISLINQTWRAFERAGIDQREMSVIQANHILTDYSKPVQICSIDTLTRRPVLPETDIVIFDECHKRSILHSRWMKEAPEATFIGLSATPWAKGMSKHWDRMIVVSTPRKLIDEGYLSDFKFYAPASPDLTGVKTLGGDFKQDDLSRAMNKIKLVADIVTTWIERAKERPTLCFAVDCAHALSIQKQFEQAGISAGYIDAYTEVEEREAMIERLRNGDLKVICNVGTMTTGVDAPFVSCIILARPTKSEMLYLQIIGRGLRLSEGKDHCLILDHSDTGIRLGLPDQIEYYDFYESSTEERRRELKKKNKGPKEPKPCPKCQFLRMPGEVSCLACGFTPQRQSRIVCQSGELVELGKNGKATGQQSTYVEKQEFWSGLLYYAAEREYKRGWASYKFKEKFGTWPDGLRDYETYPTQQVLSFIRSRNIAWAKGKARSTNKPVRF